MNYEQRYKEALERARSYYNNEEVRVGMTPIELEEIFPELKESEDEKIRKAIISVFTGESSFTPKEEAQKYVAWLEKQGEQKHIWSEEDEIGFSDTFWAIQQARTIAKDENDMGNLWYAEDWLKSLKERLS